MKKILALCMLFLLFRSFSAIADSQFNFNLGADIPQNSDTYTSDSWMARLQLETQPRLLTALAAFQGDYGSSLYGGEFAFGLKSYPFWKMADSFRAQPFLGVEGLAFAGSRNSTASVDMGVGFFGGADFRIGEAWGTTFQVEYTNYPQQRSARLWVGIFTAVSDSL